MTRYTLDGDYLYTSDVRVAAEFVGGRYQWHLVEFEGDWTEHVRPLGSDLAAIAANEIKIRIHRDVVREKCEAKENEPVFIWLTNTRVDTSQGSPEYHIGFYEKTNEVVYHFLAANALTIGQTIGELRGLYSWLHEGEE